MSKTTNNKIDTRERIRIFFNAVYVNRNVFRQSRDSSVWKTYGIAYNSEIVIHPVKKVLV